MNRRLLAMARSSGILCAPQRHIRKGKAITTVAEILQTNALIHLNRGISCAPDEKMNSQQPKIQPETNENAYTKELLAGEKKSKTKRKRQMRPLAQHKQYKQKEAIEFQQQVNCIPLAESFDLEALQSKELFTLQFYITKIAPEADNMAIHCQHIENKNSQQHAETADPQLVKEFYVFSDGVVVFWNIDKYKQEHIIDHLRKCQSHAFSENLSSSEAESMDIEFTLNQSNAGENTIYLNANLHRTKPPPQLNLSYISSPQLERFAFSHAMAASVRMGVWECELEEVNDKLEQCIDKLKAGKLCWNAAEARKMIGQIAGIRHSVNSTELLETNIYWDMINTERVYNSLAKRLKLQNRQDELNQRIDYCEYFTKTVHEMLDQKHSHRLEWIIIFLIFVEVVINWPELVEMHEFTTRWLSKMYNRNPWRSPVLPEDTPSSSTSLAAETSTAGMVSRSHTADRS